MHNAMLPCHLPVARLPELSTDATSDHGLVRLIVNTTSAFAGRIGRFDFHVDVLTGDALHLLESLFEVAQVEHVAGSGGKRGLPFPTTVARRNARSG